MTLRPKIKQIKLSLNIDELITALVQYPGFSVLESCQKDKWTILGIKPFKTLSLAYNQNPWQQLEKILNLYKSKRSKNFPILAGAIGFLGYELNQTIEKLPRPQKNDLNLPDLYFNFYKNLILYNNKTKKYFVSFCDEKFYDFIKKINIDKNKKLLYNRKNNNNKIKSNLTKKQYLSAYKKIAEHIRIGDVYQINLAQRLQAKTKQDPAAIFLKLKKQNPVPYSAYLAGDNFNIISSSPELFLKSSNKNIEIRPIKGTIKRSKNKKFDLKLKKQLLRSQKDKAELDMITDLERNDLNKIAKIGSVQVVKSREIKAWPTIWHTESKINAKLDDKFSNVDLIKACFPCGSITGCPKIRAMEIIGELEPHRRSVYTGNIGYIGFDGDLEFNVAIRTMIHKDDQVYFSVGGGIIADSTASGEYEETFTKAEALINAL